MTDTRYILVTVGSGQPVYTNGHKYSLRRGTGKWRVSAWGSYAREKIIQLASSQIGEDVRWEPDTHLRYTQALGVDPACLGCRARDTVIKELLSALNQGWIDLKSNKFKRLTRMVEEVNK